MKIKHTKKIILIILFLSFLLKIGYEYSKFDNDFYTKLYCNIYYIYNDTKYTSCVKYPFLNYLKKTIELKNVYGNEHDLPKQNIIPLDNPRHYLAMAAIFRNEERFLKEWIEYHKLVGVEHFYLFNHLSNDNFKKILDPYIEKGEVTLVNVVDMPLVKSSKESPKTSAEWYKVQHEVYETISKQLANEVEWLAVIDTDEFLVPLKKNNLKDILKDYNNSAALSVNWRMFGTNGVQKTPENELLIDNLLQSQGHDNPHIKTIIRPRYVTGYTNPHFPHLRDNFYQTTENKEYIYGPFNVTTKESQHIRINHYVHRDLDFAFNTKLKRIHVIDGNNNQDQNSLIKLFLEQDKNLSTHKDEDILRFSKDLREKMFLQ